MTIDLHLLNTLDWVVITLLIWSVFNGVWVGFSNEIFGLFGLIAALILTPIAGHWLDKPLSALLSDTPLSHMFTRVIIFLGCVLVIHLIASAMASTLREMISTPVDHTLGVFFGFARGALIVLLPFLLVNLYVDPKVYPDWLVESQSYPFLMAGARGLRGVIPDTEIRDHQRTDFGVAAEKKAKEEAKKVKDKVQDATDEDSSGNSAPNDVIESVKKALPVD